MTLTIKRLCTLLIAISLLNACLDKKSGTGQYASTFITTGDKQKLLTPDSIEFVKAIADSFPVITIDTSKSFQSIDGFGYALTGGSAYLINQKLSAEQRKELLEELFTDKGIRINYLRVSVGSSDLDDEPFTLNDLPKGKTDKELKNFSLAEDQKNLIPVLKEIIKLNPDIKIMGSPWSAPAWMKDNNSLRGGSLKPEYYQVFADYFVKYIKGYEAEGITIDAITLQNEPENPNNNPSMVMTADQQATFVKNNLGPAFEKAGIKTKIVVFDHNCDHPEYPITVLNDPEAKKYIDGSAFHLYLGEITALSKVHDAHPDKNLYFTEQWTSPEGTFGGDLNWHVKNLIIGATRNWSRNVLEWNLAADPQFNPHTDEGGCTMCLGALTIDSTTVTRNVSYYIIAHASKFVPDGSTRIDSSVPEGLPNVAFQTPAGKKVIIVLNDSNTNKKFNIQLNKQNAVAQLQAGAVATYIFN
jgi:glucosylceramidase